MVIDDGYADAVLDRLLGPESRDGSLVSRIVHTVARDIIEGRLLPEAQVNSVDLAARFEASRSPVREALMILANEGLVYIVPRRRPRVASLDFERAREIYRLRATLNALVAEDIAQHATDANLDVLRSDLDVMVQAVEANDPTAYFWVNASFHERAARINGDVTLKRTIDSLGLSVLRLRRHSLAMPNRMERSLQDHLRLMRAFEESDADLAAAVARSIITQAFRALSPDAPIFTPQGEHHGDAPEPPP